MKKHLYIVVFVIILISPVLVSFFDIKIDTTVTEKRKLTKKPTLQLSKEYPKKFEQYFNDNFGLRPLLINWNSKVKLDYFKISPKPKLALFGKEGFMFFNVQPDAYQSYSNLNIIDNNKLEDVYQKQVKIKATLEAKNIKYVLGFFPNKHTVYKENLPLVMKMQITKDMSLADQLVAYFRARQFPLVDVRKELIEAKTENQLYLKLDTHWNSYGAFVGYNAFCNQTFNSLGLTPFEKYNFAISFEKEQKGDLTKLLGINETNFFSDMVPNFVLKDPNKRYEILETNGYPKETVITKNKYCGNLKTALIFRDSYTTALIQFLSLHYYKVIYIPNEQIDMELVERTKPDVVISLSVERFLPKLLK